MAKVKDTVNNAAFIPEGSKLRGGKPLNPTLTIGMSKDSPFHMHSGYTKTHPSTKQLLDYGDKKRQPAPCATVVSKLPVEQQILAYESSKQPKMFTNIMREGMSKEMQVKISNHFNQKLNRRVKQTLAQQKKA